MRGNRVKFETIMVAVGRKFTVRLKSSPTTRYFWQMRTLAEGLQLLGSGDEKPMDPKRRTEKPSQFFCFCAPTAGEYTIKFVLKGRTEVDAIQAHTVTVIAN
jgi:predicted secreted protein